MINSPWQPGAPSAGWNFDAKTSNRFIRYALQQLMKDHASAAQRLCSMEERLSKANRVEREGTWREHGGNMEGTWRENGGKMKISFDLGGLHLLGCSRMLRVFSPSKAG